jgi:3-hydroxybutyryl-CoA dehydrogenase
VTTIAVIGAGVQGRAFAVACARAGLRVVLEDVLPSKLRQAEAEFSSEANGLLIFASTVEDAVREADIAIDFVPDELESKLEIVSMIDRMAPPRTILCIPTLALSVSDLASCTYRADRCIGVQWQSDGATLVRGVKTSDETVEAVSAVWAALGGAVDVVIESGIPA